MIRRTFLISIGSLFILPCAGQFGVANKKRGTTFDELNEAAKEQAVEVDGMGNIAGGGADGGFGDLTSYMSELMNDPEMAKLMQGMNADVEGALEELKKLSPDQFASQMKEAMSFLTSSDMLDKVMENKDEVLKNLEKSGIVDKEAIQELANNPEKLESDMRTAFSQMQEMFSDPEAMKTVTNIAKSITDVLQNPDKLVEAMNQMSGEMFKELGDDDKIEEARLELLKNPELSGNPVLASVYGSDEMKEILQDPIKWRETVKKGQGMLLGRNDGAAAI